MDGLKRRLGTVEEKCNDLEDVPDKITHHNIFWKKDKEIKIWKIKNKQSAYSLMHIYSIKFPERNNR